MKTIIIKFKLTHSGEAPATVTYTPYFESAPCAYVGHSRTWNFNDDQGSDMLKNTVDENFDITSISTYYRFPKLNLSRDKMSMLKDAKGIKKVLDKNKADLWVVSKKYMTSLVNFNYRASLSSVMTLRQVLPSYDTNLVSEESKAQLLALCEDMDPSQEILLKDDIGYIGNSIVDDDLRDLINALSTEDNSYSSYVGYIDEHNLKTWDAITSSSKLIIEDKVMNNIASSDSVTINNEIYCSIVKMLKGSKEDRTVAMSTMANCNIGKSVGYLALLFFHFNDMMKADVSYNHVVFKGLKDQFSKYVIEYSYQSEGRYSAFVELLAKENELSVEILNHITHLMFERCLGFSFGDKGSSVFRLKSVDIDIVDKCKVKVTEPYTTLISSPTYALPF